MDVFEYHSERNSTYAKYLELLGVDRQKVKTIYDIPLMPISFCKHHSVKAGDWTAEVIFKSSGTTGSVRSQHHIKDLTWYEKINKMMLSTTRLKAESQTVLGLLPSYLENGDSSLVYMVNHLAQESATEQPFMYLYNHEELEKRIASELGSGKKVLLFGVSFALLDFAESYSVSSSELSIVFTGGMKNKRRETTFEDIHQQLQLAFPKSLVVSEYGMTEMLSQAYSDDKGIYTPGATLKIIPRDINDPMSLGRVGKTNILGVVDLANVDTMPFLLTEDLTRVYEDGKFEVLGRMTESDLRGCNLLYMPD